MSRRPGPDVAGLAGPDPARGAPRRGVSRASGAGWVFVDNILFSELGNFFLWFVKFAPIYAVGFPLHRAQWFQGGTAGDYLLGRLSLWAYVDAPSHKRATYPRCVAPETSSVKAARLATTVRDVARGRAGAAAGFSLSTFRRRSECVAATLLETRERVATPAPEARSPVHSP